MFCRTLFSGGLDSLQVVLGQWVQQLANSFLGKVTDLIFVDWLLACDISDNRAGLIGCQDLRIDQRALLNLKLVMPSDQINMNRQNCLQQAQIIAEKHTTLLQSMSALAQTAFGHWQRSNQPELNEPFRSERLKVIQEYAESRAYQRFFE